MGNQKVLGDHEILDQLLKEMRYSANAMSKEIGQTAGSFYHILNGENNLSDDLANKIIAKFPQVNYLFLKLGQLPIILEDSNKQGQENLFGDNKNLPSFDSIPGTLKDIKKLLERIANSLDPKL